MEQAEAEQQDSVAGEQTKAEASAAKAALRCERDESKEAARREREAAKELARRERRAAKARRSGTEDDGIVEPPRAPRTSFLQRRRDARPEGGTSPDGPGLSTSVLAVAAGIVGAVGLTCSVVLALGALLAALGTEDGTVHDVVSSTCDVLVGPLRDLFTFSGADADMLQALVARGLGSMVYLVAGLVAQSVLRSRIDD